jgi:hypothetical protein
LATTHEQLFVLSRRITGMAMRYRRLISLWLPPIYTKGVVVCGIVACGPLLVGVLLVVLVVVLVLWGWLLAIVVLGLAILRHHGASIGVCLVSLCDSDSVVVVYVSRRGRRGSSWEADGLEDIGSRARLVCLGSNVWIYEKYQWSL